jgi:MFS family permease
MALACRVDRIVHVLTSMFGSDADVLGETDFQLLLLANIVSSLGTALLSPVLDSLIAPFGASPASTDLVMSFYVAPATVMIPVAGVLADRFGRKAVLVPSLVLFGLLRSAIAFSTDFRLALVLRLV